VRKVTRFCIALLSRCVGMSSWYYKDLLCRGCPADDCFLSWPKTGLQVATTFFQILRVFFGAIKYSHDYPQFPHSEYSLWTLHVLIQGICKCKQLTVTIPKALYTFYTFLRFYVSTFLRLHKRDCCTSSGFNF
jgi:hypothetical protein